MDHFGFPSPPCPHSNEIAVYLNWIEPKYPNWIQLGLCPVSDRPSMPSHAWFNLFIAPPTCLGIHYKKRNKNKINWIRQFDRRATGARRTGARGTGARGGRVAPEIQEETKLRKIVKEEEKRIERKKETDRQTGRRGDEETGRRQLFQPSRITFSDAVKQLVTTGQRCWRTVIGSWKRGFCLVLMLLIYHGVEIEKDTQNPTIPFSLSLPLLDALAVWDVLQPDNIFRPARNSHKKSQEEEELEGGGFESNKTNARESTPATKPPKKKRKKESNQIIIDWKRKEKKKREKKKKKWRLEKC